METDRYCYWDEDADQDSSAWETGCDQRFEFFDGNPNENLFKYCPYCGKHLRQRTREDQYDAYGQ